MAGVGSSSYSMSLGLKPMMMLDSSFLMNSGITGFLSISSILKMLLVLAMRNAFFIEFYSSDLSIINTNISEAKR